jgi:hypothetical protein
MGFAKRFKSRPGNGESSPLLRMGSIGGLGLAGGGLMRGWNTHSRSSSSSTACSGEFEYDDDMESITSESDFGDWGCASWESERSGAVNRPPRSSSFSSTSWSSSSSMAHPELDGVIFRAVPTVTARGPTARPYKKAGGRRLRIEHVDHMKLKTSPCRPSPIAELPTPSTAKGFGFTSTSTSSGAPSAIPVQRYTYNSFVPPDTTIVNPGYQEWQDSYCIDDEVESGLGGSGSPAGSGSQVQAAVLCSRFGHQVSSSPYDMRYREDGNGSGSGNGMVAVMGWLGKKRCRRCGRNVKA